MFVSSAGIPSSQTASLVRETCSIEQSYSIDNEQVAANALAKVSGIVSEILSLQIKEAGASPASDFVCEYANTSSSVACVYSVPQQKRIVWDRSALETTPLPTAIFWTLFEQLNIQKASRFQQIENQFVFGDIGLDQAVEEFEQEEYMNALEAKRLMLQAVKDKIIEASEEQFDLIASDFHTHYLLQQLQGYSHRIATRLDPTSSSTYGGTWQLDLDKLSVSERKQIKELIFLKAQLSDHSKSSSILLKLGCNLFLFEKTSPGVEKPTIIKAMEDIFSSEEIKRAKNQARQFFLTSAKVTSAL